MKRLIVLVITLLILTPAITKAEIIASYSYEQWKSAEHSPNPLSSTFIFFLGPYDNNAIIGGEYDPPNGSVLSIALTPSDVGTIWSASSGPAFGVAVDSLTNGILDSASWSFLNHGTGGGESYLWYASNNKVYDDYGWHINGYYGGTNGIDLQGFLIDSISFQLNRYEERHVDFNLFVTGSPSPVPEPASILLLGTGLIGVIAIFRKKKF